MNIFPQTAFTASELMEIQQIFTKPTALKYLNSLAYNMGADICTSAPAPNESAESYLRRIEYVKGGLGVIDTLLQINAANQPQLFSESTK